MDCKSNKKGHYPNAPVCQYNYSPHHTLFSAVQIPGSGVERLDGKHHYVIPVAPSPTGHTVVLCVQQTEELEGWIM